MWQKLLVDVIFSFAKKKLTFSHLIFRQANFFLMQILIIVL